MITEMFLGSRGGKRAIVCCKNCGKKFDAPAYKFKTGRAKYCSRSCRSKVSSVLNYQNLRPEQKRKLAELSSDRLRRTRRNQGNDETKQPGWAGDEVGYAGLHQWVSRRLGKANYCSFVVTSGGCSNKFEWANISRKYHRNLTDWMPLCQKCHRKHDSNGTKAWETRRRNGTVKWANTCD